MHLFTYSIRPQLTRKFFSLCSETSHNARVSTACCDVKIDPCQLMCFTPTKWYPNDARENYHRTNSTREVEISRIKNCCIIIYRRTCPGKSSNGLVIATRVCLLWVRSSNLGYFRAHAQRHYALCTSPCLLTLDHWCIIIRIIHALTFNLTWYNPSKCYLYF